MRQCVLYGFPNISV